MFGTLFLSFYDAIEWFASWMPRDRALTLRARWALWFSSMTDGGLDDDFAAELFALARAKPAVLDDLGTQLRGDGIFALRRRMTVETIRHAVASGRTSFF